MITPTVMLMGHGPIGDVVDLALEAERAGFGRCWIYDEGLHTRDVWVTLAAIAHRTERIPIGPGITNPYTRHPGVTAMAAATLAEMSGGRAFLGLGVGGGLTLGPLAMGRPSPARTMEDMVRALRELWSGETVDVESAAFSLRGAKLGLPPQRVDLWVAGRGPRITELGARHADGFHLSFVSKRLLPGVIGRIKAIRPVRISYSTMLVADDDDLVEARRQLSFRIPDQPPEVHAALGIDADEITSIRKALGEGGPALAAELVREEWLDEFVLYESTAKRELESLSGSINEFAVPVLDLESGSARMQKAAGIAG